MVPRRPDREPPSLGIVHTVAITTPSGLLQTPAILPIWYTALPRLRAYRSRFAGYVKYKRPLFGKKSTVRGYSLPRLQARTIFIRPPHTCRVALRVSTTRLLARTMNS
jgi:hypothetical protein